MGCYWGIRWTMKRIIICFHLTFYLVVPVSFAAPPKLSIFHFDVNTGDATLIVSPDGRGVLIDAGDTGRGKNPIVEFMNRAKQSGFLKSLDYTIVTHYDSDHVGGMDEVYTEGWYPEVAAFDRGNSHLRPFDQTKTCPGINMTEAQALAPWGTAPAQHCPLSTRAVTCSILEYFTEAERGGKRKSLKAGDIIELDNNLKFTTLVANATDIDGDSVEVFFAGRRDDCAENDLSIGLLVEFGDFRYLIAGDLTGDPIEKVANVEGLIKDNARNIDVYHVNHHGAETSSSSDFMEEILPTVAIVSNGSKHGHPRKTVIDGQILSLNPAPAIFLTNLNPAPEAWQSDHNKISDLNLVDFDGMIEIAVWTKSYRIWRWRDGNRIDNPGIRFLVKER
jgi:beta-lactamase superfamily II metal-dependent hydrolase